MGEKVIICEDHPIYAQGILDFLEHHFSVVGNFNNGKDVLDFLENSHTDFLLLDLNLPDIHGIDIIKELKNRKLKIKIVIISMYNDKMLIEKCKRIGVHAYCNKLVSNNELLEILNNLKDGRFLMDESLKNKFNKTNIKSTLENFEKKINLTKREIELVELFASGLSNKLIASKLNVSSFTVDTHKKNIFKKMNINTTVELVKFYYENL